MANKLSAMSESFFHNLRCFPTLPLLLLMLFLSGCSFSRGEDIIPPANYKEPVVEVQPTAIHAVTPLVSTDPAMEATISPTNTIDNSELASSPTPGAESTIPGTITFTGKITNGTPGGIVPGGLKVTISAYRGMSPVFEASGAVGEDGVYTVDKVEYASDWVYFAQVEANGIPFNSDILYAADISGGVAELPVKIFDATTDTAKLRVDRLHIFFDFIPVVQVVNLFIISNLGDHVVVSGEADGSVIQFDLPQGVENLQFQDGEVGGRYLLTKNGFSDRLSVIPGIGQHQVLFAYDLPYNRKKNLEIKVPLPVEAVIVMVPPGGVMVKSAQLADAGQRDVQGLSYQLYQGLTSLERGDTLALTLSGEATTSNIQGSAGSCST
jgi:hypothetical protein